MDDFNDAVNKACGELANGCIIQIELERGSASVTLLYEDGDEEEMWIDAETTVAEAIISAVALSKFKDGQ